MRRLRLAGWVIVALLWAAAVHVWPRLQVGGSEASRNWQATADVTLATIVGTIVVLVLTVGLLAVQMLSPYGWRATRMLVNRWFYVATSAVIVGGVVMPVWVAANPSPFWTRLSFVGFGWSLLLIAFVGTAVVMRMSPHALVAVVVSRARTTSVRALRRRPVLDDETEVLIELFGSPALPDSCRQPVTAAIVHTMAIKWRVDKEDFETHLEALTTAAEQLTSSKQLDAVVTLLRRLTEDDMTAGVMLKTEQTLRRIAAEARLSGKREVAKHALGVLVELNVRWLMRLLPVRHLTRPETPDSGIVTYGAEAGRWDIAAYTVEDVVRVLRGHLSAPHPSSEGWPDGWQGTAAFEEDVRRIASLPVALYSARRYVASEAAEKALAEVATSGREELVAELLGEAMRSAYRAGFDQRALATGGRLLAAATDAVERDDLSAVDSYLQVLRRHLPGIGHLHSAGSTVAHGHRDAVVLGGLITHTVPLLAASVRDKDRYGVASGFVDEIVLNASQLEDQLEERGWRARLAATEWPAKPLPEVVLAMAETRLTERLHPVGVSANLVLVLWANAVLTDARDRLREVVSATLARYVDPTKSFDPATYAPFATLCHAAVEWAEGRGQARVPSAGHATALKWTVIDRRYHGLTIDDETAVLVVESDGSHRLLRTEDGHTSQEFTWSYPGSGPHAFARALVDDTMAETLRCPACLGAAPVANELVTCAGCDGTGHRFDPSVLASLIVDRVIRRLPRLPGAEPAWPDAEWTLSHELLVAQVTGQKLER